MEIRIILIDTLSNKTYPYEFNTYEEAIRFLQSKLPEDFIEQELPQYVPEERLDEPSQLEKNVSEGFISKIKNIING